MADAVLVDVPDDIFGHVLQEDMGVHGNLMTETVANIAHVHNIARQVGVKKYHQVDPIESAAAQVVLRLGPIKQGG